ncbi:MAG: sulfite exporter TauE/SafE family protein [Candidatus Cloacimonetes bacterium]|nr:sulfite exporter TauE/SafE family protein [Candidatus Cloacimonadota bacterium]
MELIFITPVLFFVISFLFSMLGMGGSQLYIPILYWMGMDFKTQAIPLGMLLNVVNSSSASITYGLKKMIDFKVAIPFGIAMVLLAPLGAWLNVNLPTRPMIFIFATFTAIAAILMLSGWKPKKGEMNPKERTVLGISGGSILGFFAGLLGRGGGSFVVPLLYIAGLEAKAAAATSAFVVTFSGLSSFVSHIVTAAQPRWSIWLLCVVAVLLGSQLGSRVMATKLKSKNIKTVFGTVLLLVAAILVVQNL